MRGLKQDGDRPREFAHAIPTLQIDVSTTNRPTIQRRDRVNEVHGLRIRQVWRDKPSEGRESGIKGRFIFRFCDSSRQTEQPPEQKNSELTTTTTAEAAEH